MLNSSGNEEVRKLTILLTCYNKVALTLIVKSVVDCGIVYAKSNVTRETLPIRPVLMI